MSSFQYQQNHSRRIVPPGASRKRKERGGEPNATSSNGFKANASSSSNGFKMPAPKAPTSRSPSPTTTPSSLSSNRLLAGYMAYEYLTKGTLFGQKYDPARSEAVPLSAEPKRSTKKPVAEAAAAGGKKKGGGGGGLGVGEEHESYAEVASILKSDGAHIPGIVNPTQLAKWIQM